MILEVAAIIIVSTARRPIRWLLPLAAAGELLTTWPFGIMTAVIFLPFIVQRLIKRLRR